MSTGNQEKVAAVGFATVMAAVLGPVGLVLAAIAVGTERALRGDAGVRASAQQHRASVADHRQWLAEDAVARERDRAARRQWLRDGADPATRPTRERPAHRWGRWLRRAWARTVVAADDFATGCRDGWRAASQVRRDGGTPLDVVRAHPVADELPGSWRDDLSADERYLADRYRCIWPVGGGFGDRYRYCNAEVEAGHIYCRTHTAEADLWDQPEPQPSPATPMTAGEPQPTNQHPQPDPEPLPPSPVPPARSTARRQCLRCPRCGAALADVSEMGEGFCINCCPEAFGYIAPTQPEEDPNDAPDQPEESTMAPFVGPCDNCGRPIGAHIPTPGQGMVCPPWPGLTDPLEPLYRLKTRNNPTPEENPMTAPTRTQGETNLDHTEDDLRRIGQELAAVDEGVDELARRRATLDALVRQASERATATGATAATQAALDAARGVIDQLSQHLGGVSDAAATARDEAEAARNGLKPAQDAQDALHAAGAKGEFVSAATAD